MIPVVIASRIKFSLKLVIYCVIPILVIGCGGGGSSSSPAQSSPIQVGLAKNEYFPLNKGDKWFYRSDNANLVRFSVTDIRSINGTPTAVVLHTADGSTTGSEHYYTIENSSVIEIPTPASDALTQLIGPVTLFRTPIVAGDKFTQIDKAFTDQFDIDGDGKADKVQIKADVEVIGFESISAISGNYTNAAHVRTLTTITVTNSSNGAVVNILSTQDDWFVANVGLVSSKVVLSYGNTTEVHDLAAQAYKIAGKASEFVAPTVKSTTPVALSTNGAIQNVNITFSEPLDYLSVDAMSFGITDSTGTVITGSVTYSDSKATFIPAKPWSSGTYTVHLSNGLKDLVDNSLAATSWGFNIDVTKPDVISSSPASGATNVPLDSTITIDFSEEIDPATISINGTIILQSGGVPISAIISIVNGKKIVITPYNPLIVGETYTVSVNAGISDRFGNLITQPVSWSFSTIPPSFIAGAAPKHNITSLQESVAIGDITGDGRADLIMATSFYFDPQNDYKLFVFKQLPDGSFDTPVQYSTSSTYSCRIESIQIADINRDGKNDVILSESGCGVEILLQTQDGKLTPSVFLSGLDSHKVQVIDINRDGKPDIVGAGWGTNTVSVWLNNGDGTFTPPNAYSLDHYGWEHLAVGDFNGDGRPDIAVTSGQGDMSKSLAMIYQQPDGSFGRQSYRATDPYWGTGGVAIGDINGDGRNDVIVSFGGNAPANIGVLYQQTDGTLGELQKIPASDIPREIVISDINGDGRQDIVVYNDSGYGLSVYLQKPDGILASRERYGAPSGSGTGQMLAMGDLNGDGKPDIVTAGLSIFYNASKPTTLNLIAPSKFDTLLNRVHPKSKLIPH